MKKSAVDTMFKVNFDDETPYIETRARVIRSPGECLPEGKVLLIKMPILPPGASEEEVRASTTTEIVDDDHPDDPFYCDECEKAGIGPHGWLEHLEPWPPRPAGKFSRKPGRNEPCPCGSGNKFKKCCLHGYCPREPGLS